MKQLFTSESVTEGHPDKICDRISDSILDEILKQDPHARVACETVTSTGLVLLTGEITTSAKVNYTQIAREVIAEIGYNDPVLGFCADNCTVLTAINKQSPEISNGVNKSLEARCGQDKDLADEVGAGDQGIMFGYACEETPELMPFPIAVAHRMALRLAEVRKDQTLAYLRPDGKTQVTVEYQDNQPVHINTIVISSQHDPEISLEQLEADLIQHVIRPVLERYALKIDEHTRVLINPAGSFVIGGPHGDAGLTGRKVIVDTYGGYGRHGGGAFSGKDATKVDRSAAYAARYVAKNLVAAKLAERCEVQISYAIGMARPVSISVFSYGTGVLSDELLSQLVMECFDLRPYAIIEQFDLKHLPSKSTDGKFYQKIASYGHFGRFDLELPWEQTNKIDQLQTAHQKLIQEQKRVKAH